MKLVSPARFLDAPLLDEDSPDEAKEASAALCVSDELRAKLEEVRDAASEYVRSAPEQKQLYLALVEA